MKVSVHARDYRWFRGRHLALLFNEEEYKRLGGRVKVDARPEGIVVRPDPKGLKLSKIATDSGPKRYIAQIGLGETPWLSQTAPTGVGQSLIWESNASVNGNGTIHTGPLPEPFIGKPGERSSDLYVAGALSRIRQGKGLTKGALKQLHRMVPAGNLAAIQAAYAAVRGNGNAHGPAAGHTLGLVETMVKKQGGDRPATVERTVHKAAAAAPVKEETVEQSTIRLLRLAQKVNALRERVDARFSVDENGALRITF